MELLIACAALVLVLAAALTPFETFLRTDRVTANQNDSQDNARNVADNMVHQLRNLSGQTTLIDYASSYDIVFQTIDPAAKPSGSQNDRNIMRVRYCLDTTNSPASTNNGRIWEQTLKWTTQAVPTAMPSTALCPDTSWGSSRRVMADNITNMSTAQRAAAAPLFKYFPAPVSSIATAAERAKITSIRVDVFSDRSFVEAPKETEVTSGALLRNQNGAPTASFTATPGTTGSKQLTLNAANSTDPEGLPMTYRWCDVTTVTLCDATTQVGTGVQYTYTAPATGNRKIQLQIFDSGGLEADAGPTTVAAP